MTTIKDYVVAMGVPAGDLQNTDEYFEVIQSLRVGDHRTQVDLIHPGNTLADNDLIQIRRRVGALGDVVPDPLPTPVFTATAAQTFDGAQQKVAHSALFTGSHAFTLAAKVRVDGQGSVGDKAYGTVFGYSGSRRLLVNATTGALLAQMGGTNLTGPGLTIGTEGHLAYTFDGLNEKLYANGTLVASNASSAPTWTSAWWEGAYGDPSINYSLKGQLRNRAVYDVALTASQVATVASAA